MALIKCPECGREISDKAASCPSCGCPIGNTPSQAQNNNSANIETYLNLARKAIQGQNSDQVEKYCQSVLEIDPQNAIAWELEARGILFNSSLNSNKVSQAIAAAANAVEFTNQDKAQLALSLYSSIQNVINTLYNIAVNQMPLMMATPYIVQCMSYQIELLAGIPNLPKQFIEKELSRIQSLDNESKYAFMPRKRLLYASHVGKPEYAEQARSLLRAKGIL